MSGANQESRRCALVTGSSNGIGEAIVLKLARLDYKLVVTGRSPEDVRRVADECAQVSPSGERPREIVADLELEQQVDRLFEETIQHFSGRLDLLVNNAGFGWPVEHSQPDDCYAAYKRILQINLSAAVRLSLLAGEPLKRTAADRLAPGGATSIINIGSIAARRPGDTLFAYGTSKAALAMFTQCLAVELAPSVRVNCLTPGPVETKIIERSGFSLEAFREAVRQTVPLGRAGRPEELAEAALFLADPERGGYITGADLTVDGGTVLAPMHWR